MPKIRAKQAFGLKLFETNEKFLIPKPALAVINRLQAEYQKLCHRFRIILKSISDSRLSTFTIRVVPAEPSFACLFFNTVATIILPVQ
jgi:hypothetical protein